MAWNTAWPSDRQPVGRDDLSRRLAAALFVSEHNHTPPESVRAHPAADDFPGPVPADAPRITRSLTIDTSVPRWHSTGLYAPPGELITVKAPPGAAAAEAFGIRVGAHSDRIWRRTAWKRMPEISRRFPISETTTLAANAFGGLIYVEVPDNADLGSIVVEIEGAVAAPRFVLGETDLAAWRDSIRHAPAPWAEIEGRNMIVTTDSREVRGLDDPAAVAEVWDRVLDLNAELAAWSSPRRYPERFVVDRQTSNGYMHAGYPLMAHLDQQANLVNAEHLRSECNWGFYHEVGHNHQSPDWTFDGTVEVTVNLFTLYVYEFLCGIVPTDHFPGSDKSYAEEMARHYNFDDPDFELWKRHPFLALIMYEQMQEAFGWEAYRSVFAAYRALPDEERPKNDGEKRDQWLVRFSRQVGRNLGPFFEAWGVPTSQTARDSIADLPPWLPPDFPPAKEVHHTPKVRWVRITSRPHDGQAYGAGEDLRVQVHFNAPLEVTGSPTLALRIGNSVRLASLAWTVDWGIVFRYAVQPGDVDPDGISIPANALALGGGSIRSETGADAELDLGSHAIVNDPRLEVDGTNATPGEVLRVGITSSPSDGTAYAAGEVIVGYVLFNVLLEVTGSPTLALKVGSDTHRVPLGLNGRTFWFRYAVQAGDSDMDGISIPANALALNGGSIRSVAGAGVDIDLGNYAIADATGHKVDGGG